MYYSKILIDEICVNGKLEVHRKVIEDIFSAFELKPCSIACKYNGTPSVTEFNPNGTIIRLDVKDRESPLNIIWDLMHEYGHFFNGSIDDKNDKNKIAISEYKAWRFADEFFDCFLELQQYRTEFNKYRQVCFSSYIEALQLNYKVEPILRRHMPSLIELLGEQAISWTSIDRGLTDFIKGIRTEFYKTGEPILKETTFYSILTEKTFGGNKADAMFDYYNLLFGELNAKMSTTEKKPIRKIVYDLLANLNNSHMDCIGELSVLNYYLDTGEYDFITIEEKINDDSNVSADISLRRKSDGQKVLIEVLNLRLEKNNITDLEKMKYHLDSKFADKKKKKHYSSSDILKIQPVLWYRDDQQFKWIRNFFIETGYSYVGILPPLVYCSLLIGDKKFKHIFDNIISIPDKLPLT